MVAEISDEEFMRRVKYEGDRAAHDMLVARHTDAFRRVAFRICKDTHRAEDIVQNAFTRVWDKAHTWSAGGEDGAFKAWFSRIVRREAFRALKLARPTSGHDALNGVEGSLRPAADEVIYGEDQRWQGHVFDQAMAEMTHGDRTLLSMLFDGVKGQRAAAELGITPEVQKLRLHRARKKLMVAMSRIDAMGQVEPEPQTQELS